LKRLLIILFLSNFLISNLFSSDSKQASLLILDKSASTKYKINFSDKYNFRNLDFELISCKNIDFDKYIDQIALIKIIQKDEIFIGWFFKHTDELNLYSNKIYEISLDSCFN
tara:strand:- start:918 stop:1253 length:336 start_codon:yes stop_codon:yes gene_type:complete